MKLKIAICDDESSQREYMKSVVTKWAQTRSHFCEITDYPSAEAFLFEYSESKDYDILLLDIEMKEMNGVELAKRVRSENEAVQMVFITGYPDFISDGYDVCALHYLMKPVSEEKLISVLDRAIKNLSRAEKRLMVSFDRQTEYIPFSEIVYLEAQMNYTVIHTRIAEYKMKSSLSNIENKLDDGFFRCQRSFIVNLAQVQRIKSDSVVLKNGKAIPISRGMSEQIGKAIIEHF